MTSHKLNRLLLTLVISLHTVMGFKLNPAIRIRNDVWWGPGDQKPANTTISNFIIQVPKEILLDINVQLERFLSRPSVPSLEGAKFYYGFNTLYLQTVIKYWRDEYSAKWMERLQRLNTYPQYTTVLNGLKIHFIRVAAPVKSQTRVLPILLLHGWPGSAWEFHKILPLLNTGNQTNDFVFEAIVPSLPGYGFSDGPSKQGMGPMEMAIVLNNLMKRLGFKKYYVQGGDWGSVIARILGQLYPKRIKGIHSNLCLSDSTSAASTLLYGSVNPSAVVQKKYQHLMYPFSYHLQRLVEEMGYFHLQATRPDTLGIPKAKAKRALGVSLGDSPAGLAAYILEKFALGTNWEYRTLEDGGLTRRFSLDELLDNVMIYWISNSITTSMRLYYEYRTWNQKSPEFRQMVVKVPTACARFHHDIFWQSDVVLAQKYKRLVQVTDYPDGGHFAAMELPQVLARDIVQGISKIEQLQKRK